MEKVRITPNKMYTIRMPYSEVCMFMRVAGELMEIELLPINEYRAVVQLYRDGHVFSSPILASEAGILSYDNGWYGRR